MTPKIEVETTWSIDWYIMEEIGPHLTFSPDRVGMIADSEELVKHGARAIEKYLADGQPILLSDMKYSHRS